MPNSDIRYVEIDLASRGYAQRHWRRGVMGTRVFAKGNERVVIVRNVGLDRHPPEGEEPTLENWFKRLQAVLQDLVKGAKLTDLMLFGGTAPVPEGFLDWCKSSGIRVHVDKSAFGETPGRTP